MSLRYWRIFLLLASTLASSSAMAGSRGYNAVMVDIGEEDFFSSQTYRSYLDGEFAPSDEFKKCWNGQATGGARGGSIIRKKLPKGMTVALARGVWNRENAAIQEALSILRAARAPNGGEVDGLYVLEAKSGEIAVLALGARAPVSSKNPSKKKIAKWDERSAAKSAADLDLAICTVSSPLGYKFNP